LLDGVNDSDAHARALADRALAFQAATGKRPRLSILAYNPIASPTNVGRAAPPEAVRSMIASPTNVGRAAPPEAVRSMISRDDPFARSPREREFRAVLAAAGLPSHRRYSGGSDVAAACGQLAARV
jgi:23S rRNA (adenine2503-C2)-methyltransferase